MALSLTARRRVPTTLRRLRQQPSVLAAAALTVALSACCAAALAGYGAQAGEAAVRRTLAQDPAATVLLSGSAPANAESVGTPTVDSGATSTAAIQALTGKLDGRLSAALGGIPITSYGCPELESLTLPGGPASGGEDNGRVTTLLGPPDLSRHARLLSGTWPSGDAGSGSAASSSGAGASGAASGNGAAVGASGGSGGAVPVAVTEAAARALSVSVGGVLSADSVSGQPVRFEVVGIFAPVDPAGDPYWRLDPLGGAGRAQDTDYTVLGPLYAAPATLLGADPALDAQQLEWSAVPDFARFGTAGLAGDGAALSALLSTLSQDADYGSPQASTDLPTALSGLATSLTVAESLVLTDLLELLTIAAAVLTIIVRMLTETRAAEAALLWARGGTGRQLIRLRAAEPLLLALPALALAPLTARPLAAAIGRLGVAAGGSALAIPALDGAATAAVWTVLAVAVLTAAAVVLAPAFAAALSPVALRAGRGRQRAITALGRAGLDLGLVALAVLACARLAGSGSVVGTGPSGGPAFDPIAIAAPALALAAGAALLLRLLPLGARLGERPARRGRGLALPLALWRTGRRPLRLAGPLLLTMLAVAAVTLSLSEYASARQSAQDQAAFGTGSDLDVHLGAGPAAAPTPDRLAAIAASPGVLGVTTATSTPFAPGGDQTGAATLLALDTGTAARTVILRPDLSAVPLADLMARISALDSDGTVPVLETTAYANTEQLHVGDVGTLGVANVNVQIRIVGVVQGFPSITAANGGLVVGEHALDEALTAQHAPLPAVTDLWIRDPSGAVPAALPTGAVVTARAAVAAELGTAPLAEEPIQALLAVAVATVLLGLCGLGVGLISAGGEDVGEFALLDALGLTRGGRMRLLALEQALLAVPGAVAGAALGVLLAHLVVPAATLTAQATQPQPSVLVHTPWAAVWAAAGAAAALFAALPPILAAVGALRRGRPAATVLRDGTDR